MTSPARILFVARRRVVRVVCPGGGCGGWRRFRESAVDNGSQLGRPVADRVRRLNGVTLLPLKRLAGAQSAQAVR